MLLKKNDILLILLLLALGFLPLLLPSTEKESRYAQITVNGTTERIIGLASHQEEQFTITTEKGSNTIQIKNGTVSVHDADCPDQICVKSSPISQTGEIIACLPHKLLIEIKSDDK